MAKKKGEITSLVVGLVCAFFVAYQGHKFHYIIAGGIIGKMLTEAIFYDLSE